MAFQFASTNLVFEIGIVLWIFLGWQFTPAEFVGGLFLITCMWAGLRWLVSRQLEDEAPRHAIAAETGHAHHAAGSEGLGWRQRLVSVDASSDVAHNFRGNWQMLGRGSAPDSSSPASSPCCRWDSSTPSSSPGRPGPVQAIENVLLGPVVALLTFVCSLRNVPLAAVLWGGGISFAGVIAFIYADLLIVPLILIYLRYYGRRVSVRLVAIMFVAMAASALAVDAIFSASGLVPSARPSIDSIAERAIAWNYTTFLNIVFLALAAALFSLTLSPRCARPGLPDDRRPRDALPV